MREARQKYIKMLKIYDELTDMPFWNGIEEYRTYYEIKRLMRVLINDYGKDGIF